MCSPNSKFQSAIQAIYAQSNFLNLQSTSVTQTTPEVLTSNAQAQRRRWNASSILVRGHAIVRLYIVPKMPYSSCRRRKSQPQPQAHIRPSLRGFFPDAEASYHKRRTFIHDTNFFSQGPDRVKSLVRKKIEGDKAMLIYPKKIKTEEDQRFFDHLIG